MCLNFKLTSDHMWIELNLSKFSHWSAFSSGSNLSLILLYDLVESALLNLVGPIAVFCFCSNYFCRDIPGDL